MNTDTEAVAMLEIIRQRLDPQSEEEFNELLDAFRKLELVNFHRLSNPTDVLHQLLDMFNDEIDSGYMQLIIGQVLKFKDSLSSQIYYDTILDTMRKRFSTASYSYCNLLLRDLNIGNSISQFKDYLASDGNKHKTFVTKSFTSFIEKFERYDLHENSLIFRTCLRDY